MAKNTPKFRTYGQESRRDYADRVRDRKVTVRFMRGMDEEATEQWLKSTPAALKGEGDPAYEYRMARHIVTLDGKPVNTQEALPFVRTLIGRDSATLRQTLSRQEPGVDLTVAAECPSCRTGVKVMMPLTGDFFPSGVS